MENRLSMMRQSAVCRKISFRVFLPPLNKAHPKVDEWVGGSFRRALTEPIRCRPSSVVCGLGRLCHCPTADYDIRLRPPPRQASQRLSADRFPPALGVDGQAATARFLITSLVLLLGWLVYRMYDSRLSSSSSSFSLCLRALLVSPRVRSLSFVAYAQPRISFQRPSVRLSVPLPVGPSVGCPFSVSSRSIRLGLGQPMKTFQAYLPSGSRTYSCVHCRAHLADHDDLISKVRRTLVARFLSPVFWFVRRTNHTFPF
ncbi:unnamed protein product [Soboliphyme baturini]|uniref:Yippee domain-containing protein n=1 Tax=Soboliphyme baturini TaxID=241478 RepID=A0A183J3B1_9BILA|nr:unnamed protein product [Soboliphyme baturini]